MSSFSVALPLFEAIFTYAQQRGITEDELLQSAGLDPRTLNATDKRVELADYEKLFLSAAELTGDNHIGLSIGSSPAPSAWGVLYFLSLSTNNLSQSLHCLNKFFPLAMDFIKFDTDYSSRDIYKIKIKYQSHRPNRHVIEHLFANCYNLTSGHANNQSPVNNKGLINYQGLTSISGATPLTLDVIGFKHSQPESTQAVQLAFPDTKILYDQPHDFIQIFQESNRQQSLNHNTEIHQLLVRYAEEQIIELKNRDPAMEEVSNLIAAYLPQGTPRIDDIASKLGCSARTLQRRLRKHELSYQSLVDNIRKTRAIELLLHREFTVLQVAHAVGFNEDSSFRRAFKRWTGLSPSHYRSIERHKWQEPDSERDVLKGPYPVPATNPGRPMGNTSAKANVGVTGAQLNAI